MDRIFAKLLYMLEKQLDTVLVTIIADQGSAPRGAGSQMLVGREGRILGTIGGGSLEGGEFKGEWIWVYVWLSPFAVHLKLSQYC